MILPIKMKNIFLTLLIICSAGCKATQQQDENTQPEACPLVGIAPETTLKLLTENYKVDYGIYLKVDNFSYLKINCNEEEKNKEFLIYNNLDAHCIQSTVENYRDHKLYVINQVYYLEDSANELILSIGNSQYEEIDHANIPLESETTIISQSTTEKCSYSYPKTTFFGSLKSE